MKAAVLTEFGAPLELKELPEPKIGPKDVLVRVGVSGVCYSDVKIWKGKSSRKPNLPHIMGHEVAGTIAATGANVSGLDSGDRVILYLYDTCDQCYACRTGQDNYCYNMGPMFGFSRPGSFAEYISVPAKNAFKIPNELDMLDAAVIPDAMLTPYHAIVSRAQVKFNELVMLIGMGGLALHGLQILKLMGARVIAVSRSESKLEIARKLGADFVISSVGIDLPSEILKLTENAGVDCVIDFAVTADTLDQSIRCLKKGGRIVLVGYQTEPLPLNTALLLGAIGEVSMSRYGTRQQLKELIQLVADQKLKSVIEPPKKLEEVNTVLSDLSEGKVKGRATLRISP